MKRVFLVFLLTFYAITTYLRVPVFVDDRTLWQDAADKAPCLARPHARLALWYQQHGDVDRAGAEWSQIVKLTLAPCDVQVVNNSPPIP